MFLIERNRQLPILLHVIIDCPFCKSRVDAKAHGSLKHDEEDFLSFPYTVELCACPSCGAILVGQRELIGIENGRDIWGEPRRLWPEPKRVISLSVPPIVKVSLEEADRCFAAAAYSACAVMAGRALEGVCVHFKSQKTTLSAGLKALKDQEIIDARLYKWGEELRQVRNLGAHATTEKVSMEDARDVLHFVHATCDYVFVLSRRFDAFMKRKEKKKPTT